VGLRATDGCEEWISGHRFGSKRQNVDIETIALLMGHESSDFTHCYAELTDDAITKAFEVAL
jgi:hypothetical protein